MMTPTDIHTALMVNTVESLDHSGLLIPHQARREADELLEGDLVGTPSESLSARARALGNYLAIKAPNLLKVSDQLNTFGSSLIGSLILLSFFLGFGAHSLGEGEHFHLISPVLLGLIIWNLLSMTFIVWSSRRSSEGRPLYKTVDSATIKRSFTENLKQPNISLLSKLFNLFSPMITWFQLKTNALDKSSESELQRLQIVVLRSYLSRLWELTQAQVISEMRRCLHLMSIAFVCGTLLSAYWDGLIQEYRASAESTFLSVSAVESLLSFILMPSSLLGFGEVTLSDFTPSGPKGILLGEAALWIHRYAVSLVVWVMIPRLILVMLETFKVWRIAREIPYSLRWFEQVPTLNIGLASHTNIGKTSLARTLLRRDVGVVKDGEHVTRSRSCYFLINQASVRVRLWDTPGFGELHEHPIHEASTSLESRLETEAFEALRDEADLILYLVPAWPNERELSRTIREIRLLASLEHPMILVINRLRDPRRDSIERHQPIKNSTTLREKTKSLWSKALGEELQQGAIDTMIILDAFEKPLSEERALYESIHRAVPNRLKPLTSLALGEWEKERATLITQLASHIERCLNQLVLIDESCSGRGKRAKEESVERLNHRTEKILDETLNRILDCLGLVGELRDQVFQSTMSVTFLRADHSAKRKWGAIWGGAVSGLTTGVVADVMSGGLSLGGGMIVGAVLGAIGGASLVEGYEYFNDGDQRVTLSVDSIMSLFEKLILFTLDASAHGRAQGEYMGIESELDRDSIDELQTRCAEITDTLFDQRSTELRENIQTARDQKKPIAFKREEKRRSEGQTVESLSTLNLMIQEGMERI